MWTSKQKYKLLFYKLHNLINEYPVARESYPSYLEKQVQEAVNYKRNGELFLSINTYLQILEEERKIYPLIIFYIYKALICTGYIDLAYYAIVVSESLLKKVCGEKSDFGIPWAQETHRNLLEEFLFMQVVKHGIDVTDSHELMKRPLIISEIKKEFIKFATQYSGGCQINLPEDFEFASSFIETFKTYLELTSKSLLQNNRKVK